MTHPQTEFHTGMCGECLLLYRIPEDVALREELGCPGCDGRENYMPRTSQREKSDAYPRTYNRRYDNAPPPARMPVRMGGQS